MTRLLRATLSGLLLALALLAFPGLAGAQSDDGDYSSQPPPADDYTRQPADDDPVGSAGSGAGARGDVGSGGSESGDDDALAVTGGDVAQLAAVGGVLVLVGGAVLVTRRRTTLAA